MAVTFDGSTKYVNRTSTLAGVASAKTGTLAYWFKATANPGNILLGINAGGNRVGSSIESSTGKVTIVLRDSGDNVLWSSKTAADYSDSAWHHVAISWDLAATTGQLYVDRTLDQVDATAPSDGTVDYAGVSEWIVGANTGGSANFLTGEMYDIGFWPGVFVDLSVANNLRKFVSSDGLTDYANPGPTAGTVKPVGYGADGSIPTKGTRPALYLSGPFSANRGTGGAFTASGALAQTTGPLAYRQSPLRATPGERWFDSDRSGFSAPRSETFIEGREGIGAFGQRLRNSERDDRTRNERPGLTFSRLILGDREDDAEDRKTKRG